MSSSSVSCNNGRFTASLPLTSSQRDLDSNRLGNVPAWELPNGVCGSYRAFVNRFPIALVLAWAYDITPQGIQSSPKTPGAHRRRNLILLIVTAVIVSASAGFFLWPRAVSYKIDKSVAVLPFQIEQRSGERLFR